MPPTTLPTAKTMTMSMSMAPKRLPNPIRSSMVALLRLRGPGSGAGAAILPPGPCVRSLPASLMEKSYFTDYCGEGSYDVLYLQYSGIEHCIRVCDKYDLDVRSVLVLGAATGRVLDHFVDAWGVKPHGCEICDWAHARIPAKLRRRIARADMRDHVPELLARRRTFDLIFSNSLVYLEPREIPRIVDLCSRIGGHFHFYSSTAESYEPNDRHRVTLRPSAWWAKMFRENGFRRTRSPYLWRSERRGIWPGQG